MDVGFLGAAQIDRYARINTTVIGGTYEQPRLRLPGAGGAPEIATSSKETWIILKQSKRSFVEELSFVTSSGYVSKPVNNPRARGRGRTVVITDPGMIETDPAPNELVLVGLHHEIAVDQVLAETSWPLRVAETLTTTPAPTDLELATLRDLQARTLAAHGGQTVGE